MKSMKAVNENPAVRRHTMCVIDKSSLECTNSAINDSQDVKKDCDSDNGNERNNIVSNTVSFFSNRFNGFWRKPKEEEKEIHASLEDVATQITQHDSLWNVFRKEVDDSNVVTSGGVLAVLDKFTKENLDGSSLDDGKSVSYSKMQEASARRNIKKARNWSFKFDPELKEEALNQEEQNQRPMGTWFSRLNASLLDELDTSTRSMDTNQTYPIGSNDKQYIYMRDSSRHVYNNHDNDLGLRSSASIVPSSSYELKNAKNRRRFTMITSSRKEDYEDARKNSNGNNFNLNDDIYIPEESRFGFMDRLREEFVVEDPQSVPRGNIPGTDQRSKTQRSSSFRIRRNIHGDQGNSSFRICQGYSQTSSSSGSSAEQSSITSFNVMNADALRQSLEKKSVKNMNNRARRNSVM